MYTNNYSSIKDEVYLSEAEKLKPQHFKDKADFYIESLVGVKIGVETARNYYSSVRDQLDFEYLEDIYGMQNPIDLGFTNIIKPRVDALVGLSLLSEPVFSVAYTDSETVNLVDQEKMDGLLKELDADFQSRVKSNKRTADKTPDQKPDISENPSEGLKDWLSKVTNKYGDSYKSSFEIAAENILRHIETDADIDMSNIKKEVSKDYFTTGEGYTRSVYKGKGKDPIIECVKPENIFTNRPRHERDLKKADVVVTKQRVTVHNILKELGDVISKKDAELLFTSYSTLGNDINIKEGAPDVMISQNGKHEMDREDIKTGYANSHHGLVGDLVDFYHVEWLASTRISDGKGGHVYREDRYESYRVGTEIHIGGRRCEEAPRSEDSLWKTTLSYSGLINVSPKGVIESMINNMREIQDLYDIMMFFRNNTVANSGVSGSRVNVAAIPKSLGNNLVERLSKWIVFRKQGLELVDPTEDGAQQFNHYGDFDSSVNHNSIQAINAILESLAAQADIISGVPRQMLGIIEQRDAVENVKVGINQVSVLSLELFKDIDRCLNRTVQETLDAFKFSYKEQPKRGVRKHGTTVIPFVVHPSKFAMTDYKVSVISAGIENPKLLKIINLSKELVAAGALPATVMIKILNKKSVHEIENLVEEALEKQKEENISIQKMQQALEESQTSIKQLEAEIARLTNNAQAQQKDKLKLETVIAEQKNIHKLKELDLIEKKNIKEGQIKDKEILLKAETVELEKEELLFATGNAKEVNNNLN
jgi:hypothetical protein